MTGDSVVLYELSRTYRDLQEEARTLTAQVGSWSAEADEADHIHPKMRAALQSSGLAAVMVPAAYGGRFDSVDSLAATVVREVSR